MLVVDAVVIGAGPNGLVAANLLADAGWEVVVLEDQPEPGGAVKTAELTAPDFRNDRFSAFYPLAAASPVIASLDLEAYGLRWLRAPVTVAHPVRDGSVAYLSADLEETCASLEAFAPGDGDAFRRVYGLWERIGGAFMEGLFTPFPPVRAAAKVASALGPVGLLDFARFSLLPVRRFAQEEFRGEGAARLFAGNALHADLTPDSVAGAFYGLVLIGIGQQLGWPFPEGGAGQITAALVGRLQDRGGRVECNARVTKVLVRGRRARGVRTADGREVGARRAVLADVGAPQLYLDLLEPEHVPARVRAGLERFQYDSGTVKVDWALDGPVPWTAEPARRAGTVHVTEGMDALTEEAAWNARGLISASPFLLFGQYALTDPSRQPEGCETCWAYTHVPQRVRGDAGPDGLRGVWDEREMEIFVARMEAEVEALAPGFRDLIRARHVMSPKDLQAADANLVGGSVNGGTAQLHQQLIFRPVPGLARPETPVDGLYLASASAHPGGGVHGACGANAARAAEHTWLVSGARRFLPFRAKPYFFHQDAPSSPGNGRPPAETSAASRLPNAPAR